MGDITEGLCFDVFTHNLVTLTTDQHFMCWQSPQHMLCGAEVLFPLQDVFT